MVTFEDGKIVCVQKAIKEGQKSTKVIMIVTITMVVFNNNNNENQNK